VVQQVKALMSLQQLRLLMWHGFYPWSRELPHAMGVAKKKKKKDNGGRKKRQRVGG